MLYYENPVDKYVDEMLFLLTSMKLLTSINIQFTGY